MLVTGPAESAGMSSCHKIRPNRYERGHSFFFWLPSQMQARLNFEQRKCAIKLWWKHENAAAVIRNWPEDMGTAPTRLSLYRIRDKFDETGSIMDAPRSGRPVKVCTQENLQNVAEAYAHSPKKSTRRASSELSISRTSLQRMMSSLGLKPYRPRLIHGLLEDDPDRRLEFCDIFLNEINENPEILDRILWTDEANFKLSGHVNRHNCVYWNTTNQHVVIGRQINQPGLTVWGGISSDGLIGPIFFDTTVNGEIYLNLLRTIIPTLKQRCDFNEMYFMQDGAPPHYASPVRTFLDQIFPSRWLGRRGAIEWPPRSPDLTPMDFFVWGVVKDDVYGRKPSTVREMKLYITDSFNRINENKDLCSNVCRGVKCRLEECAANEGRQFEHLS